MLKTGLTIALLWLGVWLDAPQAQSNETAHLFPMPEEIRNNVEFWKKVYAVYPTNQVLIHDINDLSIIYEIVDIDNSQGEYAYRQEWRKIEAIKDEYRSILTALADRRLDLTNPGARAKRVLEIYGAEADPERLRTAANSIRGQLGLKDRFLLGMQRSGLYLDFIEKILAEHGLPRELAVLPHVESSFNYKAYSKVGAAGLWQFTRYTGRLFMRIDYDIDERLDPLRATEAAAKLLKLNYSELGSWPLAITAYNHGLQGMKRAKAQFGTDFGRIYTSYQSRSFGFASRNFYAEFLAALEVVKNAKTYFGPIDYHVPAEFVEIELDRFVTVRDILKIYNVTLEEFAELNSGLRPPVLNSQRRIPRGYKLRLPDRLGTDATLLAAKINPNATYDSQVESEWYRVQKGDNLYAIARKFNTTPQLLAESNNLSLRSKLAVGLVLRIPEGKAPAAAPAVATAPPAAEPAVMAHAESKMPPPVIPPPPPAAVADQKTASKAAPATLAEPTLAADNNRTLADGALIKNAIDTRIELTPEAIRQSYAVQRADLPRAERESIVTYESEASASKPVEVAAVTLPAPVRNETMTRSIPPRLRTSKDSLWIKVEPEETLGHYATWLEIPTQRLRALNGLRYSEDIRIGQRIRLSYARVSATEFERRRNEYHRSIEEDFFSTYKVDSVQTHRLKRGETIWKICNEIYQVPVWLVAMYNPDLDLYNLNLNDELKIPSVVSINPAATPPIQE
ncbi:MAG: LysM peptidoglycan-binding domain-containing protein [candidate division KSB1 bacterium]|nr:LysM peptidoglycan-binding domain-containing protein [candidate division KSB1 bacterium]MDZ7273743.1 LysM peptidoglycan-binding domain-containing protein [candidate division KSB1 bacterium]MDZ7285899.1 LysM peptidoglycan-binding domain-containing protein [candidate division KSB1 bacterium]MDZ7298931.1 LysM peptidoglycan-binding domain-containing protein [candidate division KSB1 bacterium]MDZ7307606.1 LysM peptidoglycan-binding domain-containing protein [candidate division KSB1 bacterium]